ncbi:amine sulfotransferase-like [Nematolebias whitei]|uniref:amine sulfotransferase-like n=1 Tax=Nematolebias whitei TaxID=451745 RepID=UPI00189B86F7|nr:amine sulfotransferase-like [Nematolebias whitei]
MDLKKLNLENPVLVAHKGFNLINGIHDPADVDQIYHLDIRDTDVFEVTYPKSGSIWMQQILVLLEAKGDVTAISETSQCNIELIPWIEVIGNRLPFISAPSPRLRVTHLLHHFMPPALNHKKGKVIYVARNPKDVLVSFFYFHTYANILETPKNFDDFFEKFLRGKVFGGSWFEHIKSWYSHKDEMNILFITYEEMIQDLLSAVRRISLFLNKKLTDDQLANVVKHSTFTNMRNNSQANYEQVSISALFSCHLGTFMRKGTIGDWKNHFTVAQNERFDEVFHREMKDFPLKFVWDIKDFQ